MTTALELISDALVEIGVLDPIETMDAKSAAHGLRVLNRMIQQWNAEGLMVYMVDRNSYALTASTASYTYGTGGAINATRPVRVEMASVLDSAGTEIPIDILSDEDWRAIAVKTTTGAFPTCISIDNTFPLATVSVWPIPSASGYSLVLYTWGNTADFASLDAAVNLPKGYEEAIVTNLAVRLSSSYGKAADPFLVQRASVAKGIIESINLQPLYADSGIADIGIRSFGMVVDR